MAIALPPEARLALDLLEQAGFEAWLVGGSVRDACLGLPPGDIDLATSALPAQTQAVFAGHRTFPTGLAHGTLTVKIGRLTLEVTTYRVDGDYSDRRHPDQVRFVRDIHQDLARRDFTCNAMAWHPARGLLDPCGGQADCRRGLLRAVGEPGLRFEEDALRVLRALRFACQLGFAIEEGTLRAMMDKGQGLGSVSAERIAGELNRALVSGHSAAALARYPRVLLLALPELNSLFDDPAAWDAGLRRLRDTPASLPLRWAALFVDSAPQVDPPPGLCWPDPGATPLRPAAALLEACLARLKQPGALRARAVTLAQYARSDIRPDELPLWLSALGYEAVDSLLALRQAGEGISPELAALRAQSAARREGGAPLALKDLAISGQDLLALGYQEGQVLGQALERLLKLVLTGQTDNSKEALRALARSWLHPGARG